MKNIRKQTMSISEHHNAYSINKEFIQEALFFWKKIEVDILRHMKEQNKSIPI